MRFSNSATVFATICSCASAQIVYNNTQIQVESNNQYSGASLVGYHVGAALSYIVARTGGFGSSFSFNLSATSAQLLNNDIAAGYQLPCYIINSSQISNNSGPLECGAGDQDGYYDIAGTTPPSDPAPGTVAFYGTNQWYACAVQSFTYGWVQGTIVGSFGNGVPSGPGIQNCTSIDAIAFVVSSTVSTMTSTTAITTSSSNGSYPISTPASTTSSTTSVAPTNSSQDSTSTTNSIVFPSIEPVTSGQDQESGAYTSTMATVVVPCANPSSASNATLCMRPKVSASIASYTPSNPYAPVATYNPTNPYGPVATYMGAASTIQAPSLIALVVAVVVLIL